MKIGGNTMEFLKLALYVVFVVTLVAYTIKRNKQNISKMNRNEKQKEEA